MKKRVSIDKAEWSNTREQQYRKDCEDILLKTGRQILFDNQEVFLKSGDKTSFLMEIEKPKSTWYGIWLKLKYS